jgi:hypothetical protein
MDINNQEGAYKQMIVNSEEVPSRKPVEGYEGRYSVDELGNVYSDKKGKRLAWGSKDYPNVRLFKFGIGRCMHVHRIVAETFLSKPEGAVEVNHKDGNKRNNRVDNLEWVTKSQNILHSVRVICTLHSRWPRLTGEEHGMAKLTDASVKSIRIERAAGSGLRQLAQKYEVACSTIWSICKGHTWRSIRAGWS